MGAVKVTADSQAWCCIPVIPTLERFRQEDHESEVNLGNIVSSRLAQIHSEGLPERKKKKSRNNELLGFLKASMFKVLKTLN